MDISAKLIKKLRKKTGSGFMACKKALIESKGDMVQSINYLRSTGLYKENNKFFRNCKQGSIFLYCSERRGVLLEMKSETDFVSKNLEFQKFGKEIVNYSGLHNINDIEILKEIFNKKISILVSRFQENIVINKMLTISDSIISSYNHLGKIGVIVSGICSLKKEKSILELLKQISMHIASENPLYLSIESIPKDILEQEKLIQMNIAKKTKKPLFLIEKIVSGRLKKFIDSITLLGQNFIIDPKKKIFTILKEKKIIIKNFIRIQIGE